MYAFACIHNANIIGQIFFKLFHLGALLKRPGAQVLPYSLCGTLRGQAAPTSKDLAVGSSTTTTTTAAAAAAAASTTTLLLLPQPPRLRPGTWNLKNKCLASNANCLAWLDLPSSQGPAMSGGSAGPWGSQPGTWPSEASVMVQVCFGGGHIDCFRNKHASKFKKRKRPVFLRLFNFHCLHGFLSYSICSSVLETTCNWAAYLHPLSNHPCWCRQK